MATLKVTVPENSQNIEGMAASGMESGWRQSIEAIGKLVEQ
jgi:hypothetical protein